MHELSIARSLLDIIIQEVNKNSISRVTWVKLKVGKFTSIEPSCLSFCFELLSKDTPAEGADLRIESVSIRGKCRNCQEVFEPNDFLFVCPACLGQNIEIINGRELYIEEIEGD